MSETMRNLVRRCIYNRWFYALLAAVCLLDVFVDTLNIIRPGVDPVLDLISVIASGVAALLTFTVFLDLHSRREKP
jgi:hypothetical protein